MFILTLKRVSGKVENGRERFDLGASDEIRVETLDGDERVGFETRSSGSAGDRTAANAIVVVVSMEGKMNFIITFDGNLGAFQFPPLSLWGESSHC